MHLSWYDIMGDPQGWIELVRYHLFYSLYLFAGLLVGLLMAGAIYRIRRRLQIYPYIIRRICMKMAKPKTPGVLIRLWPSFGVSGEDPLRK